MGVESPPHFKDFIMPDQGEIVQLEEGLVGRQGGIANEIDPKSVLPARLQTQSFDRDIWERIKSHPLRNPALFRDNIETDSDSREIVRQVINAAQQRETEILLHNQSRVFSHVLRHAVTQLSSFMSRPMIPAFAHAVPPPASSQVTVNITPDGPAT